MKRFLTLITILFMVVGLAACSEYHAPTSASTNVSNGTNTETPDDNNGSAGDDEDTSSLFTVQLTYMGDTISVTNDIYAVWNDGASMHQAKVNSRGYARITGLDGDYQVTLSEPPTGYTYEPNSYVATNNQKEIEIKLYKIIPTSGSGAGLYDSDGIINLTSTGAYKATIEKQGQTLYFQYVPKDVGQYTVTSIMDVTANEINPILDIYRGTKGYKFYYGTVDDGSTSNTYTKNFLWQFDITKDEMGNVFGFGIRTTSIRSDAFPVDIYFVVERDGEFTRDDAIVYEKIEPTEEFEMGKFDAYTNRSKYTFVYSAEDNANILNSSLYKLNPEDGYYHKWNSDGSYGELLFAVITKDSLMFQTDSGKGFLDSNVTLRANGKNYASFIQDYYALYVNGDGAYAVTEELKQFLQDYASKEAMFFDGNGMAEQAGYMAAEGDQWLFACGFYRENT